MVLEVDATENTNSATNMKKTNMCIALLASYLKFIRAITIIRENHSGIIQFNPNELTAMQEKQKSIITMIPSKSDEPLYNCNIHANTSSVLCDKFSPWIRFNHMSICAMFGARTATLFLRHINLSFNIFRD